MDVNSLSVKLNALIKNQEVISNNIANANTPNFKAQVVSFDQMVESQKKLRRTHQEHMNVGVVNKEINVDYRKQDGLLNLDKSNVNLDIERSELLQNTLNIEQQMKKISLLFKLNRVVNN